MNITIRKTYRNSTTKARLITLALATVVFTLLVACGSSAAPTAAPRPNTAPAYPGSITSILATTVFEVGEPD